MNGCKFYTWQPHKAIWNLVNIQDNHSCESKFSEELYALFENPFVDRQVRIAIE